MQPIPISHISKKEISQENVNSATKVKKELLWTLNCKEQ